MKRNASSDPASSLAGKLLKCELIEGSSGEDIIALDHIILVIFNYIKIMN
jgi:hypothetical protein